MNIANTTQVSAARHAIPIPKNAPTANGNSTITTNSTNNRIMSTE